MRIDRRRAASAAARFCRLVHRSTIGSIVGVAAFGAVCLIVACGEKADAEEIGVRIRFGLNDDEPTQWNGQIETSQGAVTHMSGWRFIQQDKVELKPAGWKASTHPVAQNGRGNNAKKAAAQAAKRKGKIATSDNGVLVTFADVTPDTRVSIKTSQGDFAFTFAEIPYGAFVAKLDGAVEVERTGTAERLSATRADDDYPAAAIGPDGARYVAYVSYTPASNRDEYGRLEAAKRPGNFVGRNWVNPPGALGFLEQTPGGDQLWLRVGRDGKWGDPLPVTTPGHDIYKCALAIDGRGVLHVAWSENLSWPMNNPAAKEGGRAADGRPVAAQAAPNFEVFTRSFSAGEWGEPVNVSNNPANDVNPVLGADSKGQLWLAWQAVRDGVFRIVERHQLAPAATAANTGSAAAPAWSEERRVSPQTGSCWTPALSASADGRVAIAWDTYDKGDYDIWVREYSAQDGAPREAQPVANTRDYEARPALTHDATGGLWIAYEWGTPSWGKNFGELVQRQGTPLYRGRQIGLAVLKDGKWMEPAASYLASLPGVTKRKKVNNQRVPAIEPQGESIQQARNAELLRDLAFNNLSRIVADKSGHIWLFCRSRQNDIKFPVLGSLWLSWATYFDGKSWTGPILLPNSDNLMYNTPAVVALADGGVFVAHSTDHRQERFPIRAAHSEAGPDEAWSVPGDPFDNDVYLSVLSAPAGGSSSLADPTALKPAEYQPESHPEPAQATLDERAAITRCRAQKIDYQGKTLTLIRGEFHRHTEISGDGGNDGPLEDLWRYSMDVAAMEWLGCSDHDNGAGREYPWWLTQKTTDAFRIAGRFEPPFAYERSVAYPEGHRNVIFAHRGVRTLPRLPITARDNPINPPDTQMLYKYLKRFGGICAAHTSATGMGTDWRANDAEVEPMVEIYQGDRQNYERPGAPRSPTADYCVGGWEPKGFVNLALLKGYRLAFECSSDHISTHISYSHVYAENNSPSALVAAMKQRHVYGATDNIIAEFRSTAGGVDHMLGDEFTTSTAPTLRLRLVGTAPFAKITLVKDDVETPLTFEPSAEVALSWTDPQPTAGKTSYYYVRGEQTDGELVWVSPMWIKYQPEASASVQ